VKPVRNITAVKPAVAGRYVQENSQFSTASDRAEA
jgi:hypothetical protein